MRPRSHLSTLRNSETRTHVRELRANMTPEERRLWYFLRGSRLADLRFRHQVPLGPYVVDFLCERRRLVIEVDGGQHVEQRGQDDVRSAWLAARGYRVIRFWNDEVAKNIEGVAEVILAALRDPLPSPPPRGREQSKR